MKKVIIVSEDLDFAHECAACLPFGTSHFFLPGITVLKDFLRDDYSHTVLIDLNLENLIDYGFYHLAKQFNHRIYFVSSKIESRIVSNNVNVIRIPYGLKKLVEFEPELFFSAQNITPQIKQKLDLISGSSSAMQKLRREILLVAEHDVSVLILGENGTGKTLVASVIHSLSKRAQTGKKIVTENMTSISESLAESELFGVVAGAYTGAVGERKGLFGSADGSTLFLDEIGDLSFPLQAKILQVVQNGTYRRVGEDKVRKTDVRLICATNADLQERVRQKLFREDLYHRIGQFIIKIPPLRERKKDIPLLCNMFFEKNNMNKELSQSSLSLLMEKDWPGNIRQLHNFLSAACVRCPEKIIGPEYF